MARSGSQSLRATQLGSRLIVRIRIIGILCALTWSTREKTPSDSWMIYFGDVHVGTSPARPVRRTQ